PLQADTKQSRSRPTMNRAAFVDQYLDVAAEIDAELADQLRSMCQLDPGRFAKVLRQLGPVLGELVDLRESDPELFWRKIRELHLEATIEPLASAIRTARARGERPDPAVEAEFRALVEAQIAATLSTRQLYLDRMRGELEEAEMELARQADDFGNEVTRKMEWLLKR
ncbi:MAG: hypothetical protein QF360_10665, partial [Phycisphaerales bacterium]|nr:hypothetical protein [Phycisphaerales bacterium]